jgi:hypothetical protein
MADMVPFKSTVTSYFPGEGAFSGNYLYGLYEHEIVNRHSAIMNSSDLLKEHLAAGFKQDVNLLSAEELVNKYGTHAMLGIKVGAKLKVLYRAKTTIPVTTATAIRTSAATHGFNRAMVDIFNISIPSFLSDSFNVADLKTLSDQQLIYDVVGGDLKNITVVNSGKVPRIIVGEWISNLTANAYQFINFGNSDAHLVPLYELIDDAGKKKQVADHINAYIKLQEAKASN